MTTDYRYLDLTKDEVKNYFKFQAIDFATKEEKKKFKYFNLSSFYELTLDSDDNCCFCNSEICEYDDLCPNCKNDIINKYNDIFSIKFLSIDDARDFIKKKGYKFNIKIMQKIVLIFHNHLF